MTSLRDHGRSIFDLDGSGEISTANVASVARRVKASEQDARTLRRRLWLAVVAAVLLAATVLGLVVWGAEIVKETKIADDDGTSAAFIVANDGNATRIAQPVDKTFSPNAPEDINQAYH